MITLSKFYTLFTVEIRLRMLIQCVLYFHGFKLEREIIWRLPRKIELKNMFVSVELQ